MENAFVIRWYGPFPQEEVREWEIAHRDRARFNLYLIGGKKKYAKTKIHYYIGRTERKLLSDRLRDKNHHINDFASINEIWIGTIVNKKATHEDIKTAEKMLTSYFTTEGELLNAINKKLPDRNVYIINEWMHYQRYSECLRLPKTSIANKMPDVIIYKKEDGSDSYKLFVSQKLKKTE